MFLHPCRLLGQPFCFLCSLEIVTASLVISAHILRTEGKQCLDDNPQFGNPVLSFDLCGGKMLIRNDTRTKILILCKFASLSFSFVKYRFFFTCFCLRIKRLCKSKALFMVMNSPHFKDNILLQA